MVAVRPCAPGEVQHTTQTCSACAMSTYSFNSSASFCDSCPSNANCSGGSNLIPTKQFWHSAANSDFIVPCPNNNACNGDRNALLACKNASYVAQSGQTPVILLLLLVSVLLPLHLDTRVPVVPLDTALFCFLIIA